MAVFMTELKMNIRRRLCDGFAVGYNIVFPVIMIGVLGVLCRNFSHGGISSYQYYTVVMVPFCTVMALITAAYAGKDDAYAKTAERVLLSPISVGELVAAKIISCTLVLFFCSIVTFVGAAFVTGIDLYGIGKIILLYLGLAYATTALGTCIGLGMKNFMVVKNVINIPISLLGILGGVFFPMGTFHKFGQMAINLSPFYWIDRSIFLMLYDRKSESILFVSGVLFLAGIVCSLLAVCTFQKGEYCNGSLPGYEQ